MRVAIAIVFCLLITDVLIRFFAPDLSGNVAHIQQFSTISQDLARKQAESDNTILFLGNSLTANAVNVDQFENELRENGAENTFAFKVVPDGTSFWDWYCVAKNSFLDTEAIPKKLVIGFAWGVEKPDPSRLATHFCGISDLPELIHLGMNSTAEVAEYLLASISKLYALRETVHKRFLDALIPHYRRYTQAVNSANNQRDEQEKRQNSPARNYAVISQFVDMLKASNIETIFIAMPVLTPYSLDPKLVNAMQAANALLYDYRDMEGITSEMFMDPIHLNGQGAEIFTRHLTSDLVHRSLPKGSGL